MNTERFLRVARHRYAAAAFAALLPLALLVAVYHAQGLAWFDATVTALCFVLSGLLVFRLAWQLLVRQRVAESLVRLLLAHAVSALAFSLLWALVFAALVYLIFMPAADRDGLKEGLVWQVVWGLVIYAALVQAAGARFRLRQQEIAARNAELVALRSQLNPHFLFNTLHSLAQLAREDSAGTQDALERFGYLMRYVLHAGSNVSVEVSVEEELEFIQNFLELERLRLGERLRVTKEIDADVLELALPPLLLQPLVENAIRHGLAPRRDGGTICLSARIVHERLMIEVTDDGRGCEAGAWRQSSGLGLKSVIGQLTAHYSSAARFRVQTNPDRGFQVQISVPARLPLQPRND
jgi:signal transduction histidine kinase